MHLLTIYFVFLILFLDEFLEASKVHGELYGTSIHEVNRICEKGQICLLEIDVTGAKSIQKTGLGAKFVFITTSGGMSEIESRLRGRGTETEEKIQHRLKTAENEFTFLKENPKLFHKVLVNDNLLEATEELGKLLETWFSRLRKAGKRVKF